MCQQAPLIVSSMDRTNHWKVRKTLREEACPRALQGQCLASSERSVFYLCSRLVTAGQAAPPRAQSAPLPHTWEIISEDEAMANKVCSIQLRSCTGSPWGCPVLLTPCASGWWAWQDAPPLKTLMSLGIAFLTQQGSLLVLLTY